MARSAHDALHRAYWLLNKSRSGSEVKRRRRSGDGSPAVEYVAAVVLVVLSVLFVYLLVVDVQLFARWPGGPLLIFPW